MRDDAPPDDRGTARAGDVPPASRPGAPAGHVVDDQEPWKPESLVVTSGTAIGAAMMGFEQALRREPPAEVMAAEHMPARGSIGLGGDLLIDFPEPVAGAGDRLPATGRSTLPRLPLERGHALEEDPA